MEYAYISLYGIPEHVVSTRMSSIYGC